ncbi:MAG: bifunctional diaminohydroxyphosphoribosylaminopyrimidine deaminase/5-amino-6-(5-phosphoribosylamino)uracil reductase RibD [Tuberibacillus sp.]
MRDEEYMALAIEMAKRTKGQTSPNPLVGAVVVRNNEIVGLGAHLKAGEPHAEVHAIRMAGEKAKDATIYVTLEPCNHHGKTPPCTELIIKSGIRRVVIASVDPNPLVAGGGIKRLREAGITVDIGVLSQDAEALNDIFFHYISTKRPYVTLKSAVSLDGKMATVTGESRWITGEKARLDVHRLRHEHDAILVGVGTVIKDNPHLTVRLPEGGNNPIRIILDSHLKTPIDSNVVNDSMADTWIITAEKPAEVLSAPFLSKQNVKIISMQQEKIDIPSLLDFLGKQGITSLFVEGGSKVNGSFIQSKMVNQIIMYFAPKIIGGAFAPAAIGGEGFRRMSDILTLTIKSVEPIGEDLKIVAVNAEERSSCSQE